MQINTFSPPIDLTFPSAAGLWILRNSDEKLNLVPSVYSTSTFKQRQKIESMGLKKDFIFTIEPKLFFPIDRLRLQIPKKNGNSEAYVSGR